MKNDLEGKIRKTYRSTLLVMTVLGLAAMASQAQGYADQQSGQVDPPSRVARVSVLSGNVSIQPASVEQFNVAEPNYPMTTGDRIYADVGANAEIQTGQLAVRLGQQTDLTVTAMTDELAQFGLAQGSVHLRSYNVYQGETVEVDTPNVAVTVLQSGDVRMDVDPANDVTVVTVLSGQVQVNGNGIEQVMEPGERLRLSGGNPVYAQLIGGARPDGLDKFSVARDSIYLNAYAEEGQYINPGTIGGEDLTVYGSWENGGDEGAVWYPANVANDWQPYRNGHWTWVAPWGWTWIEAEPWGFAPFHYGRWNRFGNRWGWIPGPVVVRPIYSPALVVFVGGNNVAGGVTAWFPLGPGEAYTPWYHASDRYVNRVNVSNIYDRNVTEVRNVYNQRTVVNTYVNVQNRSYANRGVATVAMSQDNFARGGRADQAAVRVDARQLAQAPVLPHPLVTPERSMVAAAPAKALPPVQQRPVLASHEDNRVGPGPDPSVLAVLHRRATDSHPRRWCASNRLFNSRRCRNSRCIRLPRSSSAPAAAQQTSRSVPWLQCKLPSRRCNNRHRNSRCIARAVAQGRSPLAARCPRRSRSGRSSTRQCRRHPGRASTSSGRRFSPPIRGVR